MIKQIFKIIIPSAIVLGSINFALAEPIAAILSGKILLQVESRGEGWYVNPRDLKKYQIGGKTGNFDVIKLVGIGITDSDLLKIPVGLINENPGKDGDKDGLSDDLENAIGTNPNLADSDNDGYDDKLEVLNGYSPVKKGELGWEFSFAKKNAGKIFLQVQNKGQAWYISPKDNKKYLLADPQEISLLVGKFGLGITNGNLNQIITGYSELPSESPNNTGNTGCPNCSVSNNNETSDANLTIEGAAKAIRDGDKAKAASYFTPEIKKLLEYTIDFLDRDGRFALANILLGSSASKTNGSEKIYTNEVYCSLCGYKTKVNYLVKKQPDGRWLLSNL